MKKLLVMVLGIAAFSVACQAEQKERSPEASEVIVKAESLASAGQREEALTLLGDYLRQHPKEAGINLALGVIHGKAGAQEQAAEAFRREVNLDPDNAVAWFNLGTADTALGNHEEAARDYRKGLSLQPENARIRIALGQALAAQGDLDAAEVQFTNSLEAFPIQARFELAVLEMERGQFESAATKYREVIRADPNHLDALEGLKKVLSELGRTEDAEVLAAREQQLRKAEAREAAVIEAAQEKSDDPAALLEYGQLQLNRGQLKPAAESFRRAVELAPTASAPAFALGLALFEMEDAEAVQWFEKAAQLEPTNSSAYFYLGLALHFTGQLAPADSAFARSQELGAWGGAEYLMLGKAFQKVGQFDAAESAYRDSLKQSEANPSAHLHLALIQYSKGQLEDSRTSFRRVLALEPFNGLAYTLVGVVEYRLGDRELAEKAFGRAAMVHQSEQRSVASVQKELFSIIDPYDAKEPFEIYTRLRKPAP